MSRMILTLVIIALTCTVCTTQEVLCGPNEVHRDCGSACYPTCKNPFPGGACITLCVKGCFCRSGFVRDERTKKCVRLRQCFTASD